MSIRPTPDVGGPEVDGDPPGGGGGVRVCGGVLGLTPKSDARPDDIRDPPTPDPIDGEGELVLSRVWALRPKFAFVELLVFGLMRWLTPGRGGSGGFSALGGGGGAGGCEGSGRVEVYALSVYVGYGYEC